MPATQPADFEHQHLTWDEAVTFLRTTDAPEERKPLYHLLALCPECAEALQPLPELVRRRCVFLSTTYGEIEVATEEHQAPGLWSRIEAETLREAVGTEHTLQRLKEDDRWPSWGLTAWHARRSLEAARHDPGEALHWAKLAVEGAKGLRDDQPAGEEWNAELRAFAQAALGNAYRVAGELGEAEDAFRRAHEHLNAYPDAMADFLPFRPHVLALEASWLRDRRRYPEALERLDHAAAAWEAVDRATPEDRARVLLQKAKLLDELGMPDGALELHEEAAALLGPEASDEFRLAVVNNLLFYLVRLDRAEEAADWLPALEELAEAAGNELDDLRVQWVKAHVYDRAEDDADHAESLFREVLDGFCTRKLGHDSALVALDLAHLLLRRGRSDEVEELALAVKPIFEALGVEFEVDRAIRTFLAARNRGARALEAVGLLYHTWHWRRPEG